MGDFMQRKIEKVGVLLKPVSDVERKRAAWKRIEDITSRVRNLRPDTAKSDEEEEEEIAESVKEYRRSTQKHD